jgi:hypothetical protein
MIPLFIGLTLVNLLCLSVAGILGFSYWSAGEPVKAWHMLAGALAALTCTAVHSIVFTYFAATAKWVQHAIELKGLDRGLAEPTRSFRAQAFPAAIIAIAVVFLAAVSGAATDNSYISAGWHKGLALGGIAVNIVVGIVEFRAIARNGRLIDRVLEGCHTEKPRRSLRPAKAAK